MSATKKIKQGKVQGQRGTGHSGSSRNTELKQDPARDLLGMVGQEKPESKQESWARVPWGS